ncbi:MAG: hypothetical protein K2H15_05340 [Muribaculaceae bacterium]|nr:hypothetical protein [Muribaculaceae bacterium]
MKKLFLSVSMFSILCLGVSCAKVKKPEAARQHEEWIESLNDSIAIYKAQADSTSALLSTLQSRVGSLMPDFEHVSNPREVEGYYVFKGWKNRFPLSGTGMVARISENEGFELLAALSGGVFNQISVSSSGESVKSAVVPHDQALNYRAGNLNTVCFFGNEADLVGEFISGHSNAHINVAFLGGAKPSSFTLPPDAREMIAATWQLYSTQKQMHQLEKSLPLLSRKIDMCRRMLNERDSLPND